MAYGFDYLNTKGRRNINNTHIDAYNCGGYALDTFSWFYPYSSQSVRERNIFKLFFSGKTVSEVLEILVSEDAASICSKFGSKVRLIEDISELREGEVGVAYRIRLHLLNGFETLTEDEVVGGLDGFEIDYEAEDYFDYDFHFRRFENGVWTEKCGMSEITEVEVMEDEYGNWACDDEDYESNEPYIGPIKYFAVKI